MKHDDVALMETIMTHMAEEKSLQETYEAALKEGACECVRVILGRDRTILNTRSPEYSVLQALRHGMRMAAVFIEYRADLTQKSPEVFITCSRSLLEQLYRYGEAAYLHPETAEVLSTILKFDEVAASIDSPNKWGITLLIMLVQYGNVQRKKNPIQERVIEGCINVLIEYGANLTYDGLASSQQPLHIALKNIFRNFNLVARSSIAPSNFQIGVDTLQLNMRIIQMLIYHGADVSYAPPHEHNFINSILEDLRLFNEEQFSEKSLEYINDNLVAMVKLALQYGPSDISVTKLFTRPTGLDVTCIANLLFHSLPDAQYYATLQDCYSRWRRLDSFMGNSTDSMNTKFNVATRFLRDKQTNPRSLKQNARSCVYKFLNGKPVTCVDRIPLPKSLKEYMLLFDD